MKIPSIPLLLRVPFSWPGRLEYLYHIRIELFVGFIPSLSTREDCHSHFFNVGNQRFVVFRKMFLDSVAEMPVVGYNAQFYRG